MNWVRIVFLSLTPAHIKGTLVANCCCKTVICSLLVSAPRFGARSQEATADLFTSRSEYSRAGSDAASHWQWPAAGAREGESKASRAPSCLFWPLCFPQCVAQGLSFQTNIMGSSKWGIIEHHRGGAFIFNSSGCMFLAGIDLIAFLKPCKLLPPTASSG